MFSAECDPLHRVAEQVAGVLSYGGYAYVEDEHVEALSATLRAFLKTAGIPVMIEEEGKPSVSPAG
ncbi:hypothetical protein GCM10009828_053590 [Actinoplanes couchii]|uniref:Uncharacterized protein n=1 Tax=Actinoplanes couchii TaxID=403638 RepID=A0ABQ3XQT6_9ACTN|nr:hypothetical protein Aco03nite_092900 [Actinoplanes couchii]